MFSVPSICFVAQGCLVNVSVILFFPYRSNMASEEFAITFELLEVWGGRKQSRKRK